VPRHGWPAFQQSAKLVIASLFKGAYDDIIKRKKDGQKRHVKICCREIRQPEMRVWAAAGHLRDGYCRCLGYGGVRPVEQADNDKVEFAGKLPLAIAAIRAENCRQRKKSAAGIRTDTGGTRRAICRGPRASSGFKSP